jgi:2-aminoethylphosphonate-pyruvate transaminase
MEGNGQWRFTPPTHVLAAFDRALDEHEAEGGVAGRGARYATNRRVLVDGLRAQGFVTMLPDALQAPIIVTFRMPGDARFVFETFYDRLAARGWVIYPGKLTVAPSFRIGCIGQVHEADLKRFVAAVRSVLAEMGVTNPAPVADAAE